MSDSDILQIQLWFGAAAIAFGAIAITAAGWNHRYFVWSMFSLAGASALVALLWRKINEAIPEVASEKFLAVTAQPLTWFAIFVIATAAVVLMARSRIQTITQGRTGAAGPAKITAPYIKDPHIAPGSVRFNNWPEYRAIPIRKGYNATVYVEYQYFSKSEMQPQWTKRKRILLAEIDKFDVGEWSIIRVPLIGRYTKDGETRWRWGGEQIEPNDTAFWLHRESWYRARIVFIAPGGDEEYCYFKIEPLEENAGQMPHIVGQSHFDFINDWKEADAQIGKAS
jgi:hypothetical protein